MEYIGRVSDRGNQIDWSTAAGGLNSSINEVIDAKKARKAEDQQVLDDAEQLINATEQPKSQTLNEFILKGAFDGKNKLFEWNKQLKSGKINREEYIKRVANLQEYWGNLAGATKGLDARLTQAIERQQVGEDGTLPPASAIEADMQGYFGGLSNLSGKGLQIGDDGRVALGTYDQNGNLISQEDVKYINNPANIVFNRVDLNGMVNAEVENWAKWQIGRTTDTRGNQAYMKAKNTLIDTFTTNPRTAASVLVDNSGDDYTVFFNEQDKKSKFDNLKNLYQRSGVTASDEEIMSKLIQMRQDANGDYQPVLTPNQIEKAKKTVDNQIEIQVGRSVESAPSYSGGGGNSGGFTDNQLYNQQKQQDANLRGYEATRKAWNEGDMSNLRQGYIYKWKESKGRKYVEVQKIYPGEANPKKVKDVYNADGLAEFAFNGDSNEAISNWNDGRRTYAQRNGGLNIPKNNTDNSIPKKGQEVDGYIFLGGDPSNQKNWKKK